MPKLKPPEAMPSTDGKVHKTGAGTFHARSPHFAHDILWHRPTNWSHRAGYPNTRMTSSPNALLLPNQVCDRYAVGKYHL